jgi:hypothetical protein
MAEHDGLYHHLFDHPDRDRPEPGGEQERNPYSALGMGWSRWPGRPEAVSSGNLFTPQVLDGLYPCLQLALLLHRQPADTAFVAETRQTFDPVLLIQLVPGSDRVIVEKQHLGDSRTTHSIVKQHQGIGAPRQPVRGRAVTRQSDHGCEPAALRLSRPKLPSAWRR